MFSRIFLALLLTVSAFSQAKEANYAIAIGEEDKDRLYVLNEIYTPHTEKFLAASQVSKGDRVLEIGCGVGIVSQSLAHIVGDEGQVLATDISEEQLAIARAIQPEALTNLRFQQLSAYDLDSLDEKFDVVYVRFLLCHVPNPADIIAQAKGALKQGGKFIIEDLTGNDTLYSVPHVKGMAILQKFDAMQFEIQQSDDRYFAKLPRLLVDAGFEIRSLQRAHPQLDTLRKRKMLTYNLSSLKKALVQAEKISLIEYDQMYPIVEELAVDPSITVYSYELGQICAIL